MNDNLLDEEKRKRQLAIIKASNQMLEDAQKVAMEHNEDPVKREELKKQFSQAINDNKNKAKTYFNATEEEVNNSEYRDVDKFEVNKYNEYLKKRGITDEELHRKDSATVTIGDGKQGSIPRRKRKGSKKDLGEDYVPIEDEEKLMKESMVTDDKQIEDNIRKNAQIESQMIKDGKSVVTRIKKSIEQDKINNKVNVDDTVDNERVVVNVEKNDSKEVLKNADVKQKKKVKNTKELISYDFDFSSIPSYVQYDVIPLPSNGQCYKKDSPLRCGRVPVAYLTASDENLIASPNMYRDGKLLDVILKRKVLDKRINVEDLCSGDRDAIILWLRGTSYGEDFPIVTRNPENDKQYEVTINLSQFNYNDFDLEGDENGLFDYTAENGDLIKFKFFTSNDEQKLRNAITSQVINHNRVDFLKNVNLIEEDLERIDISEEDKKLIIEDIEEMRVIVGSNLPDVQDDLIPNSITEQMILHTVSINGNSDYEYIKNYIENMRTKSAMNYRNYFSNNRPGVDFNFTVNIPESDGGGSFESFLRIDDTIFINF